MATNEKKEALIQKLRSAAGQHAIIVQEMFNPNMSLGTFLIKYPREKSYNERDRILPTKDRRVVYNTHYCLFAVTDKIAKQFWFECFALGEEDETPKVSLTGIGGLDNQEISFLLQDIPHCYNFAERKFV